MGFEEGVVAFNANQVFGRVFSTEDFGRHLLVSMTVQHDQWTEHRIFDRIIAITRE